MGTARLFYRRHLPHWQPHGAIFFVTFRLKNSFPLDKDHTFSKGKNFLDRAAHGPRWLAQPAIADLVAEALHYRDKREYDLFAYCIMPNHVHAVFKPLSTMESHSVVPECHSTCESEWHSICESEWHSDSQHSVVQPDEVRPLYRIMQSLKRHTARQANRLLRRQGPFWQDESYDHVIRGAKSFERIVNYVLQNPVKAGLVDRWQDWPWTYCRSDG